MAAKGGSYGGESSKATPLNPQVQDGVHGGRHDLGRDDPLGWVYKADHYFDFFHIEDAKKVKMASFHMEGEALQWIQWANCLTNYPNWEDFTKMGHHLAILCFKSITGFLRTKVELYSAFLVRGNKKSLKNIKRPQLQAMMVFLKPIKESHDHFIGKE
ncbi:unnamed protein product [Malus baccata var. baccata]